VVRRLHRFCQKIIFSLRASRARLLVGLFIFLRILRVMTTEKENSKSSTDSKPDRRVINQMLSNVMTETALSELPFTVDAWIVDCDLEIAGTFGRPFETDSLTCLGDAYTTPGLASLMIDRHNDAFLQGSSAFSTVVGRRLKFVCLTRVFYLEKIAYVVGYSIDSTGLRDIYDQLLSIREKTYALGSNDKVRVSVDAILSSNIFKMFIKTAGG